VRICAFSFALGALALFALFFRHSLGLFFGFCARERKKTLVPTSAHYFLLKKKLLSYFFNDSKNLYFLTSVFHSSLGIVSITLLMFPTRLLTSEDECKWF
jgi:hypothetical protein